MLFLETWVDTLCLKSHCLQMLHAKGYSHNGFLSLQPYCCHSNKKVAVPDPGA